MEKTLTFEEVNAHVEQHLAARAQTATPEAALSATDLCNIYKIVRPILVLISQTPFIPQTWRDIIKKLIGVLDVICPQAE